MPSGMMLAKGGSSENGASENVNPNVVAPLSTVSKAGGVLGDVTNMATVVGGSAFTDRDSITHAAKAPVVDINLLKAPAWHHAQLAPAPASAPTSSSDPEPTSSDLRNAEDPQHVIEYLPDIYRVLQQEEEFHTPSASYMEKQANVNAKMRAILVDWLVAVQQKYKLKADTLFLAVNLLDRFLEKRNVARRHLQLVGVTALLVAAKFEEMYPPQINDFVYVTDKAYSKQDIIQMEVSMLTSLGFQICRPSPTHFLERFASVNGCTEAHRDLAQYLLELTLVEYKMLKYRASHLAAAAVLLSNKLLRRSPSWSPAAVKHTHYTEQELKECAKEMCGLLEHAEQNPLQAVRKKFSQLKYHAVAKLSFSATAAPAPAAPLAPADEQRVARCPTGGRASGVWEPPLAPRLSMGSPRAPPPAPSTLSAAQPVNTALFDKSNF